MKKLCCDTISPPPDLPSSEDDALAQLAQALGHRARVSIVRMLLERDSCICGEIVNALPLAQSTISQHLKILKQAGWIRGEVNGPSVCYCINSAAVERFGRLFTLLTGAKHETQRAQKSAGRKPRKTVPAAAANPEPRARVVPYH